MASPVPPCRRPALPLPRASVFCAKCQPFPLPTVFVAGLDVLHRPGDIEYIAAALLRLRDEAQRLAAEGMVGVKKSNICVFLVFRYSYKINYEKSASQRKCCFFAHA